MSDPASTGVRVGARVRGYRAGLKRRFPVLRIKRTPLCSCERPAGAPGSGSGRCSGAWSPGAPLAATGCPEFRVSGSGRPAHFSRFWGRPGAPAAPGASSAVSWPAAPARRLFGAQGRRGPLGAAGCGPRAGAGAARESQGAPNLARARLAELEETET